jgi:hypothetical protein
VAALALTALAAVALATQRPGPTDDSATRTPPGDSPSTDLSRDPGAPPIWATQLLRQLDCDGAPQPIGGERGELGRLGHEGTASPNLWILGLDDVDLPVTGWIEDPKTQWEFGGSDFVRYVNVVGGAVKAVLLMEGHSVQGGRGSWDVTAFRACGPIEYDELRGRTTDDAPWTNAAGARSVVETGIGPGHCGWESMVWLRLGNRVADPLYFRDPLGLFSGLEVGEFEEDAVLPPEARPTGDRSARWELFITDDPDAVWIRTDTGVERWPRSRDPGIGCA